jgi:hypothetical protein
MLDIHSLSRLAITSRRGFDEQAKTRPWRRIYAMAVSRFSPNARANSASDITSDLELWIPRHDVKVQTES